VSDQTSRSCPSQSNCRRPSAPFGPIPIKGQVSQQNASKCHENDSNSGDVDGIGSRDDRIPRNRVRRRPAKPRTITLAVARAGAELPIPELRGKRVLQPEQRRRGLRDRQPRLHDLHAATAVRPALRVG